MTTRFHFALGLAGVAALVAACSARGSSVFNTGGSGNNTGGDGAGAGTTDTDINISTGTGGHTTGTVVCNHPPDMDGDGDGWTTNEGDCNDCDANVNPGAVDTALTADGGMGMSDNDCSGSF